VRRAAAHIIDTAGEQPIGRHVFWRFAAFGEVGKIDSGTRVVVSQSRKRLRGQPICHLGNGVILEPFRARNFTSSVGGRNLSPHVELQVKSADVNETLCSIKQVAVMRAPGFGGVVPSKRAVELEEQCWKAIDDPASAVNLSKLHRYRTTSQRSLLKHLPRLRRHHR